MSISWLSIFILFPLLSYTQKEDEKGWKGITPLHSTKADVLEKLGVPNGGSLITYRFEDVNVNIFYSSKVCDAGWNVPLGTVLRVTVYIKKNRPTLSELKIDLRHYEKKSDIELPETTYYENKERGIVYVSWGNVVKSIYFVPSVNDSKLKCRDGK
jgi:hypothetical protein